MKEKIDALQGRLQNGVVPAMATPLHDDGSRVNDAVVADLVHFLAEAGVRGVFVGGTTGEGILLGAGERRRLHEAAVAAASGRGDTPIATLLHVGANTTAEAVALAEHAATLNPDAIVAVTPFFYGLHDDAILDYYKAIAAAAPETPLFVYDIPHMAVNGITGPLLRRLGATLPTLAGVKTSRPDAQLIRQLIDAAPARVAVYAGNERIALGSLALGAQGLISGLSTAVPEPFVALTDAFAGGDITAARRQQRLINALLDVLPAGARIGAIKRILDQRGIPAGPAVPPRPTPPANVPLWDQMEQVRQRS